MFPLLALAAMAVELAVGYPSRLYARIGHPVTWIGKLIDALDRRFNRETDPDPVRRRNGAVAAAVVVGAGLAGGVLVQAVVRAGPIGFAIAACLASSLIAQRSLARHVVDVAEALETGGLAAGRRAVAHIVGRDPERLDDAGVCRAAVESLAENFSDGIVAPVLWLALAGIPGAAAYKAINTADSMIGYRTPRHRAFGWATARLDDFVNLPASRLAGGLLVAAAALVPGASPRGAWRAMLRDAPGHRSPNAGWPEAALAGALGLGLAGPRHYAGTLVADAEMNRGGRRDLRPADIRRALRLYWTAVGLLFILVGLLAVAACALRAV